MTYSRQASAAEDSVRRMFGLISHDLYLIAFQGNRLLESPSTSEVFPR
jgi:hypothetical protein